MDPITIALQLGFFLLFGVSTYQFLRNRGPLELSVLAVFGSIAALFALSFLNSIDRSLGTSLRPLLVALLLAQPLLVLRLIASGKTPTVIARELALSVKTISTYRMRILEKMNMANNAELTHYAIQNQLV